MSKTIRVKDLGVPKRLLGLNVSVTRDGDIKLSQETYIDELLTRYEFTQLKPSTVPLVSSLHTSSHSTSTPITSPKEINFYQSLVGAISYLVQCTRPDLAYASCELCRYMSTPTAESMTAAKRVYRYLKATKHYALTIQKSADISLYAYTDADWSPNHHNCKSTSGYFVFMGPNPISWCSRQQSVIALSTMEAEFVALCELAKECAWLTNVMCGIDVRIRLPIPIYIDNTAAISFASSTAFERKSRHINMRYQFVKQMVNEHILNLIYVPSADNVADILTKCVNGVLMRKHIESILTVA